MDKQTISKIWKYLVESGQNDTRFKLGDTIRYTPTEVANLLREMPEETVNKPPAHKPPIGVYPYHIGTGNRIEQLAHAILRYQEDGLKRNVKEIRLFAEEIEYLCDFVESMMICEEYNKEE